MVKLNTLQFHSPYIVVGADIYNYFMFTISRKILTKADGLFTNRKDIHIIDKIS